MGNEASSEKYTLSKSGAVIDGKVKDSEVFCGYFDGNEESWSKRPCFNIGKQSDGSVGDFTVTGFLYVSTDTVDRDGMSQGIFDNDGTPSLTLMPPRAGEEGSRLCARVKSTAFSGSDESIDYGVSNRRHFFDCHNAAVVSKVPVPNGTWFHVAVVHKATVGASAGHLSIYVDGEEVGTQKFKSGARSLPPRNEGGLWLGRAFPLAHESASANNCFEGSMGMVTLYNKAIGSAKVKADMGNNPLPPVVDGYDPRANSVLLSDRMDNDDKLADKPLYNVEWRSPTTGDVVVHFEARGEDSLIVFLADSVHDDKHAVAKVTLNGKVDGKNYESSILESGKALATEKGSRQSHDKFQSYFVIANKEGITAGLGTASKQERVMVKASKNPIQNVTYAGFSCFLNKVELQNIRISDSKGQEVEYTSSGKHHGSEFALCRPDR